MPTLVAWFLRYFLHQTIQMSKVRPNIALALALNAAQVWRYFTVYSQTANKLPSMPELDSLLNSALSAYKRALEHEDGSDSIAYREACGKFKVFLNEAAELGIRVWTRFDTVGMVLGGSILFASALLVSWYLVRLAFYLNSTLPGDQRLEVTLASLLMLFYCVLLTFSNSYIDAEQHIGTFVQAVICIALCGRLVSAPTYPKNGKILPSLTPWLPLVIPLCSRIGELFVAGHGTRSVHSASCCASSSILLVGSCHFIAWSNQLTWKTTICIIHSCLSRCGCAVASSSCLGREAIEQHCSKRIHTVPNIVGSFSYIYFTLYIQCGGKRKGRCELSEHIGSSLHSDFSSVGSNHDSHWGFVCSVRCPLCRSSSSVAKISRAIWFARGKSLFESLLVYRVTVSLHVFPNSMRNRFRLQFWQPCGD